MPVLALKNTDTMYSFLLFFTDHVLRMHRYQEPGYEGIPVPLDGSNRHRKNDDNDDDDDTANANPFQKINPLLHGGIMEELRLERVDRLSGKKRKKRQQMKEGRYATKAA